MGGAASVTSSWSTAEKDWSAMAVSIQSVTTAHHPESFSAVQDSFIREQNPNTNYGSSGSMTIDGENNKEQRGLVQFDLSTIQSDATIESAYLKLDASTVDDDLTIHIYQLTESWTEGSVTWNESSSGTNWSAEGGAINATPVVSKNLQYEQTGSQYFNITDLVQDWVDGDEDNYGVMITSSSKSHTILDTREGATPPELVLVYTSPNEAPVNTVPGTQTVIEETQTAISGISVADPDAGDRTISTQLSVGNGVLDVTLSGSATISAGSNGSASLTIRGSVADINATLASVLYTGDLNVNGTAADTLTITTDDLGNAGTGGAKSDTDTVQIDISNVNDAPVITDGPDTAGLTETNAGLTTSGDLTVSDVDTTDVVTAAVDSVTSSGNTSAAPDNATLLNMLSLSTATILDGTQNSASLGWTFNYGAEAFNYLATGETLVLEYTISATDDGDVVLSDTETVTITITGTNDTSTIDSATNPAVIVEVAGDSSSQNIAATSGTITLTDQDLGDTLTVTVTGNATAAYNGGAVPTEDSVDVSALIASGAISFDPLTSDGEQQTINWTYDPASADLDWLQAGDTLILTYVARVTDGAGNVGAQNLVITITGSNDTPTIDSATNPAAIVEVAGDSSNQDIAATTGTITLTDQDLGDTLTVTVTGNATAAYNGGAVSPVTASNRPSTGPTIPRLPISTGYRPVIHWC
jgi:VCBS repeat-containing protein